MIGYKLFRVRKDGSIGSLFINRRKRLEIGKQYKSENHPTVGFAPRPGWHICARPMAPHLSMRDRRWFVVQFGDGGWVRQYERPAIQGGLWYTAQYMTVLRPVYFKNS
jgi:hypothetical protein